MDNLTNFQRLIFAASASALVLQACSDLSATGGPRPLVQKPLTSEVNKSFVPLRVNQVVVMPFTGDAINVLPALQAEKISSSVVQAFQIWTSLELINEKSPAETAAAINKAGALPAPLFTKAATLGSMVGAQGALCGTLNVFQASDGTAYGANRPAHVQFKLWLLEVESGKVLWSATFDKSDAQLSENLFRLGEAVKSGVRYRGAEQLLQDGLKLAATDLEALRSN